MPTFPVAITADSHTLLEVDFPSGTRRYSLASDGVFSHSGQTYKDLMLRAGQITYALGDESKSLQHPQMSPEIADPDEDLLNILGRGERWEQSAARVYVAPPAASGKAQWTTWYTGVLDNMLPSDRGSFTLSLTMRLRELKSPWPLNQINPYDFGAADKSAYGTQSPLVVGKHDDYGDQTTGACPVLYVDKGASKLYYVVSAGRVNVVRVYSASQLKALGTHYTIVYLTIGGRLYTLIHFLADQSSNQITCDVEGPESVGDGTGTMIHEATDILLFVLVNFVFNEYQGGNWISGLGGAPINLASFAAVKAALSGRAGGAAFAAARYFAGQTTGEQFCNEWASSMGVDIAWNCAGELQLYYDDLYSNDAGYALPKWYYPADFGLPKITLDSSGLVQTTIVQYESFASEPTQSSPQGTNAKLKKQKPDPQNRDGRGYWQLQVSDPMATVRGSVNINAETGPKTTP